MDHGNSLHLYLNTCYRANEIQPTLWFMYWLSTSFLRPRILLHKLFLASATITMLSEYHT